MTATTIRPRTAALALVAVLALFATACGTQAGSEGVAFPSPAEPTDDTGSSVEPAPPQSVEPVPPQVDAAAPDPDTPVSDAGSAASTICPPDDPACDDAVLPSDPCPPEGCGPDTDITYDEVEVVPTAGTPHAVPFEQAVPSEDGTQVTVQWWSGVPPCTALSDVEVVEDDTTVTITLFEASEHPDDAEVECILLAQAKQHTIALDRPLGDRTIIDGAA